MKDWLARAVRTFAQGALGIFVLMYSATLFKLLRDFASVGPGDNLPAVPDLNFFRNLVVACFAGGLIALVSLIHNGIEEWLGKGILKPASPPAPKAVETVAKV